MIAKASLKIFRSISSLAVAFTASVALAQAPQAPAKDAAPAQGGAKPSGSKEGKKTSVNFEDQLIEGQTQKPELFYLLQNRNNNFKRLIKLRENFLPEMRKTAEDVGRKDAGTKGSGE
ncbi:MAG: hypothetical protein V4760_07370 [Bdellovibrionota bacterium]